MRNLIFTLLCLVKHLSWVLSQSMIYEAVWKENPEHCGAAVANVVYSLRRKIGDGYIETVVGSGYRFVVGIKAGAVERRTAITLYKVTTHTHGKIVGMDKTGD